MASGLLIDYLGRGNTADRPVSLSLYAGAIGLYWSEDDLELSLWDGSAWVEDVGGGTGGGGLADGDYGDVTVSGSGTAIAIDAKAVTYAKMQDISATARVLGRNSSGSGVTEEVTLSQLLDWVGSAAAGDILYRSSGAWTRLGVGSDGQVLTLASGLPSWAAGGSGGASAAEDVSVADTGGYFTGADVEVVLQEVGAALDGLTIGADVQAYDADLAAIAGLSPANDDVIQRKAGAWTNRTMAQLKADLSLSATDVSLGNVTNDAQTKAAIVPNTAPSAGQILAGNAGGTAYAPVSMSGDATLASTGALTIAAGAVTLAKQANMATASIIYRKTAGSGAPEVQTLATLKTDLGLTGTNTGDQTTITGNAGTATALQTARTIGGVSFDGTADINLPGVNTTGNQNTSGSAATLTTSRNIGGIAFNGSANIEPSVSEVSRTTSWTLGLSDRNTLQVQTHASPQTCTIPPQSSVTWVGPTTILILAHGSGALTLDADTGVTLNGVSGGSVALNRYQNAVLRWISSDVWVVSGTSADVA